jgi:hypothetical protein
MPKCLHNRIKYICKECGGGSICQHLKFRSRCKECGGGSGIYQHLKFRSRCKECGGGSGIYQHLKFRSRCKECVANKDNTIPEIEEYSKEEYEIISFLEKTKK